MGNVDNINERSPPAQNHESFGDWINNYEIALSPDTYSRDQAHFNKKKRLVYLGIHQSKPHAIFSQIHLPRMKQEEKGVGVYTPTRPVVPFVPHYFQKGQIPQLSFPDLSLEFLRRKPKE